jgi:hypothetical protein
MTAVHLKEVVTTTLGRCYRICHLLPMTYTDQLWLKLDASMKYKLFVHAWDEDLWISGYNYFPIQVLKLSIGR